MVGITIAMPPEVTMATVPWGRKWVYRKLMKKTMRIGGTITFDLLGRMK